ITDPASSTGCLMDCNKNNQVTVDDLVIGISIALGLDRLEHCPVADANGDGLVTVDELVSAVRAALYGCYMSIPAA
ncbi:MAG TPA: hypothetical protein VLU24_04160, partial [Mycobacterium sp.]|nr:hypothetical protein [Mycobacterium sp.]